MQPRNRRVVILVFGHKIGMLKSWVYWLVAALTILGPRVHASVRENFGQSFPTAATHRSVSLGMRCAPCRGLLSHFLSMRCVICSAVGVSFFAMSRVLGAAMGFSLLAMGRFVLTAPRPRVIPVISSVGSVVSCSITPVCLLIGRVIFGLSLGAYLLSVGGVPLTAAGGGQGFVRAHVGLAHGMLVAG